MKPADTFPNLVESYLEELLAQVHQIHPPICELVVKRFFEGGCIFGIDHRVYVELERDGRVAELLDALERLEPARHSDLVEIRAEAADIGQNVDVSGPGELGPRNGLGLAIQRFGQLVFEPTHKLLQLFVLPARGFRKLPSRSFERLFLYGLFLLRSFHGRADLGFCLLLLLHLVLDRALSFSLFV